MKTLVLTLLFWAVCAAAQEPSKQKPPVIPDSDQVEYFRADGALVRAAQAFRDAQSDAQAKQADMQASVARLAELCGKEFAPAIEGKKLACVPKPKEEKK